MNVLPVIAAEATDGFFVRAAKWLLSFDYDKIKPEDPVAFKFLGSPEGWGLLFTIGCVAAIIWLTFWLYRREGKTASLKKKFFLAGVRTAALLIALFMLLEPTLIVSKVRETLAPVVVLLDVSESMTIADLYSDPADARGVAKAAGWDYDKMVLGKRIKRHEIVSAALNDPAIDFLNRLALNNPVHVYAFSDKPEQLFQLGLAPDPGKAAEEKPDEAPKRFKPGDLKLKVSGGRTYAGKALDKVMEAAAGQPLAAVVIITDGQDNDQDLDATSEAGKAAAREEIPVFCVPVGLSKSRKTKNLRLDKSLRANRTIFVGDPAEFVALVSSSGYLDKRVTARLFRQKVGVRTEKEVASEELVVKANASDQPVSLTHTPLAGDEGEYIYTIKIGPLADEHLQRDNIAVASGVRVVKTTTNVLLISGAASWEYRFLRSLLIQDRSVMLRCWLQGASRSYLQLGNKLLRKLPRERREIFDDKEGYHVIILMDIDPTDFDHEWFKMLKEFVEDKMGGVLFIAGEKYSYDFFRAPNTAPLVGILPVEIDMNEAQVAVGGGSKGYRAWRLKPTEDGLNSPLLKFSTEREMTELIWKALPGAVWTLPVKRAKPGATVLVRTMDPRRTIRKRSGDEAMPVLVSSFYGSGRVAFLASDETWRWRRLGPTVYDTFWTQVVRSLVEGRLMAGKKSMILETDSETYPVATPVTVSAKVFDARGKPVNLPGVKVKIESAGGSEEGTGRAAPWKDTITLKPVMSAPGTPTGVYKRQFVPPRTGLYRLTLVGSEADGAAATVSIEVASQFEFDHPEANRIRLAELTDPEKGGRIVELKDFAGLPKSILSKKKQTLEPGDQFSLWANPLALGLLAILLGIEWAVRKRANMA